MTTLFRLAHLIRLIIAKGKLQNRGPDFQNARRKALEGLTQFCPPTGKVSNRRTLKNPFPGYWSGQAAYIKNAFKSTGGHIFLPDQNICYIRNPKAASTALVYAMLSARYPELEDVALSPEKINFLADANLEGQVPSSQSKAVFFTVVRNPFARIVSVYREFFKRKHDHFIYADYLFGILNKDDSFEQFVNTLQMIPDRLKDQHLKPQHTLLTFYERKGVGVKILKLEEPETIRKFLSAYGLTLKAINRSDAYDYRTYFDKNTLERVYQLYQKDINLFDYEGIVQELKHRVGVKTKA